MVIQVISSPSCVLVIDVSTLHKLSTLCFQLLHFKVRWRCNFINFSKVILTDAAMTVILRQLYEMTLKGNKNNSEFPILWVVHISYTSFSIGKSLLFLWRSYIAQYTQTGHTRNPHPAHNANHWTTEVTKNNWLVDDCRYVLQGTQTPQRYFGHK